MPTTRHLLLATASALALAAPAQAIAVPRIIHGSKAPVESLPYMASLGRAGLSAEDGHFCGGTVIAPQIVLTAAHCLESERASGMLVTTGRTRLSDSTTGQRTQVRALSVHPGWDGTNNDIALVRLATPVAAPPVTLATGGTYEQSVTAGWGMMGPRGGLSDELRAVELPIATTRDCRETFRNAFDPATMVCAGGDGRDSCSGDSGGPLLAEDGEGGLVEIGIVSFGMNPCGKRGVPGVYTRVSAFGRWLQEAMNPEPDPIETDARVRIGRIACGRIMCRVQLRVEGTVDAVRVGVRDRAVQARPVGGGRWVATLNLPYGHSTLSASPLRADGSAAGHTTRTPIHVT